MKSLVASVAGSDLIPAEEKAEIESKVRKGLIGPLSPEREAGPFMLYCCGDDLDTIAIKTNFPKEILYVTMIHYDWDTKAASLRSDSKDYNPINIQKDVANTLLIATSMAVKEQLQDVLAGRKKASQCPLIPKNVAALGRLMEMVSALNAPPEQPGMAGRGGTVVHAQNVQINQNSRHDEVEDGEIIEISEERQREREAKYKALREKN